MKTGARAAAIAVCDDAVSARGTAEDMWAAAEVRVSRPELPTPDDLIRADLLANAAARLAPNEPWGALARFDLAHRWGDPELIAQRLEALKKVAPDDPRTLAAAASVRPSRIAPLLGWSALFLLCAGTLAHALRRRRRLAPAHAALLIVLCLARPAFAAFPIDDADPERNVPSPAAADARPMDFAYYLQELSDRAEVATRRGDHAAAVRYFRALERAVPDASVPRQKLCAALIAAGEPDRALEPCRAALGLPGVRAEDFTRFVELVLQKAKPSAVELDEAAAAARHLSEQPGQHDAGAALECRVADAQQKLKPGRPRLVMAGVGIAGMLIGAYILLRRKKSLA